MSVKLLINYISQAPNPYRELAVLVEVFDEEEVGERIIWPPAAMDDVDGAGSDAMDNGSDCGPSRDEVDAVAFACFCC